MASLVGLNGFARSGKDTVADMVQAWCRDHDLSTGRHGFADKLKESAAHSLGIFDEEIAWCNEIKEDTTIHVQIDHGTHGSNHKLSGREYLQYYGTEGHRDVFGSDFWVNALLPRANRLEEEIGFAPDWYKNFIVPGTNEVPAICLVTDVRFDNEAQRIIDLGGEIWRIERDGSGAGSAGKEGHASEQMLPGELVSLVIDNNGTLDELSNTVDALMSVVTEVVA